ncbi:MAG: hypothetical protein MUO37_00725 [Methyloceanibacter sp.]|nr:hypothetical protein [Methyloceanibacter sp.]
MRAYQAIGDLAERIVMRLAFGPRRAGVVSLLARHVQKLVRAFAFGVDSKTL